MLDCGAQPSRAGASTAARAAKTARAKPWSLAVRALVRDAAGRLLLLRRSAQCRHFVGQWEFPGGKADPGEAFDAALRREVREETGLEIEITGLAGATAFETPEVNVVLLCLEARATGGKVKLSEEHDDFAWVPLNDLSQRQIVASMKPVVKNLLEGKESHV